MKLIEDSRESLYRAADLRLAALDPRETVRVQA